MNEKPSEKQILGAKIRAEEEAFYLANRKPYKGGWDIPPATEKLAHLSRIFEMPPHEISYFLTWSRSCTHKWSDGACIECPQ